MSWRGCSWDRRAISRRRQFGWAIRCWSVSARKRIARYLRDERDRLAFRDQARNASRTSAGLPSQLLRAVLLRLNRLLQFLEHLLRLHLGVVLAIQRFA